MAKAVTMNLICRRLGYSTSSGIKYYKAFNNIQGYDDIKDIVRRALDDEDNYNLLYQKESYLRRFRIDNQEAATVAELELHRSRG